MNATLEAVKVQTLDKVGSRYYTDGDLRITHGLPDELLAFAYNRFKREKILDWLFYEEPISLMEWLELFLKTDTATIGCLREKAPQDWELCGMIWMNERIRLGARHARATASMGFFHKVPPRLTLKFGRMGIEWDFDNLNIDVLSGVTPEPNLAARRFSQALGFTLVGPIEGGCAWKGEMASVYVSTMTKARWDEIRPWKE